MWWHTHRHAHAQTNTRQVVTSAPCNFHCCRSSRLTARHHALLPHASSAPHSYTQGLDKQVALSGSCAEGIEGAIVEQRKSKGQDWRRSGKG
eukprot:scaffold316489_cov23-Tisochrysis_lutea.AAC.2